jgi:hypothetical protein
VLDRGIEDDQLAEAGGEADRERLDLCGVEVEPTIDVVLGLVSRGSVREASPQAAANPLGTPRDATAAAAAGLPSSRLL